MPRSRAKRLAETKRRLEEDLEVEHRANAAYEAYRARGIAADGSRRMAPGATKPYEPPEAPAGTVNLTDPDSRLVKAMRGWIQGYNAQAAVSEEQVVLAAEITIDSPDFGRALRTGYPDCRTRSRSVRDRGRLGARLGPRGGTCPQACTARHRPPQAAHLTPRETGSDSGLASSKGTGLQNR